MFYIYIYIYIYMCICTNVIAKKKKKKLALATLYILEPQLPTLHIFTDVSLIILYVFL